MKLLSVTDPTTQKPTIINPQAFLAAVPHGLAEEPGSRLFVGTGNNFAIIEAQETTDEVFRDLAVL